MSNPITPAHPVSTLTLAIFWQSFCSKVIMLLLSVCLLFASPHSRDETVAAQKQHYPLQERLLPLSYSSNFWKSCWIVWRISASISSTDKPVLLINTDFLLQQKARKFELYNSLRAWRKKKKNLTKEERTKLFLCHKPMAKYTRVILIIHDHS